MELIEGWGEMTPPAKLEALHNALNALAQGNADRAQAQDGINEALNASLTAIEERVNAPAAAPSPEPPATGADAPKGKGKPSAKNPGAESA